MFRTPKKLITVIAPGFHWLDARWSSPSLAHPYARVRLDLPYKTTSAFASQTKHVSQGPVEVEHTHTHVNYKKGLFLWLPSAPEGVRCPSTNRSSGRPGRGLLRVAEQREAGHLAAAAFAPVLALDPLLRPDRSPLLGPLEKTLFRGLVLRHAYQSIFIQAFPLWSNIRLFIRILSFTFIYWIIHWTYVSCIFSFLYPSFMIVSLSYSYIYIYCSWFIMCLLLWSTFIIQRNLINQLLSFHIVFLLCILVNPDSFVNDTW